MCFKSQLKIRENKMQRKERGGKEGKRQGGKERGRRKQADDGFIFLNFTHQLLELF